MTPDFRIVADSIDITAKIRDRLEELRVTDEAGRTSDAVTIRLDDRDNRLGLPRKGASLEVFLGYKSGAASMGKFTVDETALSGPPDVMVIRARAANLREGLRSPKARSWDNITLGALVATIAAEHGYTPAVSAPLTEIDPGHLDQTESDINLLTRLGKQYGAVAKAANGHLIFAPEGEAKSVTGKSLPSVPLSRGGLSRWDVTLADRGRYASVTAEWHDVSGTGQPQPVTVGEGEPVYRLRGTFRDEAEARAAARAKYEALQRGQGTITAECGGDVRLAAEGEIEISGIRAGVDGRWSLTHVTHVFDSSGGYRCELQGETPKAG